MKAMLPGTGIDGPDASKSSRPVIANRHPRLAALIVLALSSAGAPIASGAEVADATVDADGFLVHAVRSPHQSGETAIRVLLPEKRPTGRRFPVVYLLPVEAGNGTTWGDGLLEAKRAGLHNRLGVVLVAPTFSHLPWYADHPTDAGIRQERHFLDVVVPFVEATYPVVAKRDGRLLVGFSKSGWGAWSLLLRHPDRLGRAVAWDAPLMLSSPDRYGAKPVFGTLENFRKYEITRLLAARAGALRGTERLLLLGHGNFRDHHRAMHERLGELRIPHVYRDGPQRKHHWGGGWLEEAVTLIVERDACTETKRKRDRPLQVFLLAGQSNMEGQAVVDLDHEKHYNGGRGTLAKLIDDPSRATLLRHLRDETGAWTVRDDVWVWYRPQRGGLKAGPLSIGYAVYEGKHHFGPELQFGHVIGDHLGEQVLLIKTAWGGKSLFRDFRPPSSGGEVGAYYKKMLSETREALASLEKHFPYDGRGHEIAGFVWFQGWNDMIDEAAVAEYTDNLANLIRDVRRELGTPELPVVIAETGNCRNQKFRRAQAEVARRPDLSDTVKFVPTGAFLRAASDSPNVGHGHHWFGNAESFFLIGDAMGKAMVELLSARE